MLNVNYIIGLIDGEGSFTVYVKNIADNKERKRRTRIEPKFYVKLIEDDKEILYRLKNYFKCGNVYFQKDKRSNHRDCYRYEITKREDLKNIIIPFFKKNPLKFRTKAKDFKIFCLIMEAIEKGEHLTSLGLQKLYKLKQGMH